MHRRQPQQAHDYKESSVDCLNEQSCLAHGFTSFIVSLLACVFVSKCGLFDQTHGSGFLPVKDLIVCENHDLKTLKKLGFK